MSEKRRSQAGPQERIGLKERLATMSREELRAARRATAEGDDDPAIAAYFAQIDDDRGEVAAIMEQNAEAYLAAAQAIEERRAKEK